VPTATPDPGVQCTQNFDGVTAPALPPGWTASNQGAPPDNGIKWITTTIVADTPPNDAFVDDQNGVTDKYLISTSIVVGSAGPQLTFRNNFNTEMSSGVFWDGGVLEVSSPNINGGAFTDITDPAVGGNFVSGGYTGEIDGSSSNPLAGRLAWSGNSGGYITTVANLGQNMNGQTIKLRWRMGSDLFAAAPGWRVDTFVVIGASCPPVSPTPTPVPTATPTVTPTPAPTATPTVTPTPVPTATPDPGVQCTQNFDGVTAPALPPGWTASNQGAPPDNGIKWITTTIVADTPPNDAFVDDQNGVSDKYLVSRSIVVSSPNAQLTFRNNFNTEMSSGVFWDGGVLEVSSPNINGGAFTDITDPVVGGSFVSGGYTGEIDSTASNPLAGRLAWSGNSGGYITTVANLGPNVNGQTIKLRWRMGTDLFSSAPGWRVDTLVFTSASCP
ncbi:MAG: hypothetical protein QOG27_1514, partial [Verrucomicrobiota bacterium]